MNDAASILPLVANAAGYRVGEKWLLQQAHFSIEAGGLTAILGPNGAGKSLFLRMCHGLISPSAGALTWAAKDGVINGRKRHAMVFQKPIILRRSARANLIHALQSTGEPRSDARADEALERFGLTHLAAQPARLLSGGEQQRLALARAWSLRPQVLFLDEPTSQLDPGATRQIEDMIGVLKSEGVTLVMSTHDIAQARRLADRVLFLHKGAITEDANPSEFFKKPATATAQAFVTGDLLW